MFRHYLTISLRNLRTHPGYALLNILGLSIGMAGCLLITLYLEDELSYDTFHARAPDIYRIVDTNDAKTPSALGPALQQTFPGVKQYARLRPPFGYWVMRYKENVFNEDLVYWTDESVFDVFSITLIQGDPATALHDPYTTVITESIAQKYFGDEDPMGKVIRADDLFDIRVTGVMEDLPPQSHIDIDFMVAAITVNTEWWEGELSTWFGNNYYTYLLLTDEYAAELEPNLPEFLENHVDPERAATGKPISLSLQPLTDIHLRSSLENEPSAGGDVTTIYILTTIATFLVLIACINFMNLATARSAMRAKEVGLRKVVGAYRIQLISQFLGESMVLSFLALGLAVIAVRLLLPAFVSVTGKALSLDAIASGPYLVSLVSIGLLVGFLSGSYPALFLSAFKPVDVLKGARFTRSIRTLLGKGLVVVQFAIAIGLIIGTGLLSQQISHMQNKTLGLNKEQVLVLTGGFAALWDQYEPLKQGLLEHPDIRGMASGASMPGRSGRKGAVFSLQVNSVDRPDTGVDDMQLLTTDFGFIESLEMEVLAGRSHSPVFSSDSSMAFVLNESGARALGWSAPDEAIGKVVRFGDEAETGIIIGVVRDFHMRSLHYPVRPMMIVRGNANSYVAVRLQSSDLKDTIGFIEQTWNDLLPGFPFSYTFLDEDFARLYRTEERLEQIVGYFTVVALFIACLGLLGLASFMAERRTREIGVRKVLGASITGIVQLLCKEFVVLVLIANAIAWPVSYYVISVWLESFAYRIDIGLGIFIIAGLLAFGIALLTVGYHAVKAGTTNPVDALRHE